MNASALRDLLRQQPFEPFVVFMSSGERYEVRHPEMAWVLQNKLLIGTGETRKGFSRDFVICALLHVSSVEPIKQSA